MYWLWLIVGALFLPCPPPVRLHPYLSSRRRYESCCYNISPSRIDFVTFTTKKTRYNPFARSNCVGFFRNLFCGKMSFRHIPWTGSVTPVQNSNSPTERAVIWKFEPVTKLLQGNGCWRLRDRLAIHHVTVCTKYPNFMDGTVTCCVGRHFPVGCLVGCLDSTGSLNCTEEYNVSELVFEKECNRDFLVLVEIRVTFEQIYSQ